MASRTLGAAHDGETLTWGFGVRLEDEATARAGGPARVWAAGEDRTERDNNSPRSTAMRP